MSDAGRQRASPGVETWKSSESAAQERSGVRSIAWLGLLRRGDRNNLSIRSSNHRDGNTAEESLWQITINNPVLAGSNRTKGLLPEAVATIYAGGNRLVYAHCDFSARNYRFVVICDGRFLLQGFCNELFNRFRVG